MAMEAPLLTSKKVMIAQQPELATYKTSGLCLHIYTAQQLLHPHPSLQALLISSMLSRGLEKNLNLTDTFVAGWTPWSSP